MSYNKIFYINFVFPTTEFASSLLKEMIVGVTGIEGEVEVAGIEETGTVKGQGKDYTSFANMRFNFCVF